MDENEIRIQIRRSREQRVGGVHCKNRLEHILPSLELQSVVGCIRTEFCDIEPLIEKRSHIFQLRHFTSPLF